MENIFFEEFRKFSFTKNQKKIAQYCIDHQSQICRKTLREVAVEVGVSEVTVLNFVRKLGYEGFAEFKNHVFEQIADQAETRRAQSPLSQRLERNLKSRSDTSLLENHLRTAVQNIERSLLQNNPETYEESVTAIMGAKRLFVAGLRSMTGVAGRFARALTYLVDTVSYLNNDFTTIIQTLNGARAGDVLVLICTGRYYQTDVAICKMAKDRHATLILLSDSAISPIAPYADHLLIGSTSSISFFNASEGIIVLYEYLLAMIVDQVDEEVKHRWDMVDPYTEAYRI